MAKSSRSTSISSRCKLNEQLRQVGNELSHLPTQVDQLLSLLDKSQNLLAEVEQLPARSIQNAYSQCMKALLAEPLLRHTDADVQVAVASCINEFIRITVPEAPYSDNQMKEVLQLIVSSLKNLSDMSSRSYEKRVSILQTFAEVRSWIIMLDLECNGLLSEMFKHFLSSIRQLEQRIMAVDDHSCVKLEEQLREIGNELSQFPTQVDELLSLLDKVGSLLANLEQAPTVLIQNEYSQCMKAFLAEPLLRHTDADVQVAVVYCINEFIRITASEVPYTDNQMKEVFQPTVSSFRNLFDISSRSYEKRVSILQYFSEVGSGLIMLDLECNGLLSEMFQHFLSSIRDFHPEKIFIFMETIMTDVLEESYDDSLSLELLTPILSSLKRNNEEISTSARKLGESVLAKCAVKLKPYLKQAVNSLGLPLDGYSEIVATICNESNGEVEHNSGNVSAQKEKPEAAELMSKPFWHDDEIIAIDKNDRAADDFCIWNFGQISEKPEAAELVSKLFGHDDEIVVIDKIDRVAEDFCIRSFEITEIPEAAELVIKLFRHDDEIFAIDKNDRAADDFCIQNIGPISVNSEKSEAAELVSKLFGHDLFGHDDEIVAIDENDRAAVETAMLASKRRRDLTTEDIQTQIDNAASSENTPASGTKLEETIGILAGAADETAMPASKRRRHLTTEDIQTEIDNTAFGASGTKSQSQSQATTSKRTTESKNDDEQFSKLKETIGILAGALKDMVNNRKLPIPIEELWGFIHEMKLDEDLAGDAFVFLLDRPVQLKGLISTPTGIRKSILLKMMMRDAK